MADYADTLKEITSDINRLEHFPASSIDLGRMIDAPTDYRYLFSEKNYAINRLAFDKVHIIRILHERQDYMHMLFGSHTEPDKL